MESNYNFDFAKLCEYFANICGGQERQYYITKLRLNLATG